MIPDVVWQRWFGWELTWHDPVTRGIVICVVSLLLLFGGALRTLLRQGKPVQDAWNRWKSWTWLTVLIIAPILAGAFWTCIGVGLLCVGCYREYARATGMDRESAINFTALTGIVMLMFATLDHYDRLFFAIGPFTVGLIAIATIPTDRPAEYIRRVALGSFGFVLFGLSLGYLACFTNDVHYRPKLLLVLLSVSLNDVFAYCSGRLLGGPKLVPQTSPGKTVSGFVGALLLTTLTVVALGRFVFAGTVLQGWGQLVFLGLLISVLGQVGDLILSSIKRDLGIKDIGAVIPGHGGLLDRFDSMVLVPPAVFHYVSLCLGPLGSDQPARIWTSQW